MVTPGNRAEFTSGIEVVAIIENMNKVVVAIRLNFLIFFIFFTESILNYPARATMLKATEEIKASVDADGYQYLTDIELFAEIGRIVGLIIFFILYHLLPYYISLPAYIVSTAAIQWQTVKMSKQINGM